MQRKTCSSFGVSYCGGGGICNLACFNHRRHCAIGATRPTSRIFSKRTLLGTPNREPQEYSRYIIGIYLPGSLYSIIFLLYSWGSRFGVPSRVPLFRWAPHPVIVTVKDIVFLLGSFYIPI